MNPTPTASIQINRNLRPAGVSGNVGVGASSSSSSSFPPPHLFSNSNNPNQNALAIARVGGQGGQIFVYRDSDSDDFSYYASFPAGGRRWGVASESSVNTREHLTSYLQHNPSRSVPPFSHYTHSHSVDPLTPPSSFSQTIDIPHRARPTISSPDSLPLTPMSLPSSTLTAPQYTHPAHSAHTHTSRINPDESIISLISTVFPSHAHTMALISHTLEIVTPPENVLQGFILDHPSSISGRTVFIHLLQPSPSSAQNVRPEQLSANFSQVLRPHDPLMLSSPPSSISNRLSPNPASTSTPTPSYALDIRESLTALLDLASEALEATSLVLILDRSEDNENLGDMLHSLMYVGGQVVKPGAMEGGWVWDPTRWVLVGMEL